jgi:Fur family transcriptional regulator, ferric uptake regulator
MERDATVSLATVYRTLKLFREEGLIDEMRLGGCNCRQYERTDSTRHHHVVCRHCGRVVEFESPIVSQLVEEIERSSGFKVTGMEICLEGCCPECSKKEQTSNAQAA